MANELTNWLEEEEKELETTQTFVGEKLPALRLESGKVVKFKVDFSKKFETWTSPKGTIKAIIPVEHKGERKILWLNKRNPLYAELIRRGKNGQTEFVVSTTGAQEQTKYSLVEEE